MVDCLTDDPSLTANRLVLQTLHRKWLGKTTAERGKAAENLNKTGAKEPAEIIPRYDPYPAVTGTRNARLPDKTPPILVPSPLQFSTEHQ